MKSSKRKEVLGYLWQNKFFRYVFWGGCTTLVNFLTYLLLKILFGFSLNIANVISVGVAILFAYFVNTKFVFTSRADSITKVLCEFLKFISARLLSMVIEIGGVWLLVDVFFFDDILAKISMQLVVLLTNFFISKFLVFD